MASISHTKLLANAARKLGFKSSNLSGNQDTPRLFISHNAKTAIFTEGTLYPWTAKWQHSLMNHKLNTQAVLKKLKYKTIPSLELNSTEYSSKQKLVAAAKQHKMRYPVITKTNTGTYGLGVTFVSNEKDLVRVVSGLYQKQKHFMIQPVLWHDEYRITFIANQPIMVHKKRLPRVIGDGTTSLSALLKEHPDVLKDENFIRWNMARNNLKPSSVLKEGDVFETHIIKKRTPEYYKVSGFPGSVVRWGKKMLTDFSANTMAIDFMAPKGLNTPQDFIIFELNSNPHWNYVIDELDDTETPKKISEFILTSYFGKKK